jgi:hypothetical protein
MYNIRIKKNNVLVSPVEFDEMLNREVINNPVKGQQGRYWKKEIKKLMKAKEIATSPISLIIIREKKKIVKTKGDMNINKKPVKIMPVIEGRDPLAAG